MVRMHPEAFYVACSLKGQVVHRQVQNLALEFLNPLFLNQSNALYRVLGDQIALYIVQSSFFLGSS